MANTYDPNKDPYALTPPAVLAFGAKGVPITPSDTVDLASYAKSVVVTAAGDLKILPVKNDDEVPIPFFGCPVGFVPPFRVRRVFATGTSASVASCEE